MERLFRAFVLFVLMRPKVFSVLVRIGGHRGAVPSRQARHDGEEGARSSTARPDRDRSRQTSAGARRVLLVPGCVQRAIAPSIDAATIRVLARQDIRIETLKTVECCGSLAYHLGKTEISKTYARSLIVAFETHRPPATSTRC